MSARSSAIPFRNIGDSRVRRTRFRCWPDLVDEFSNCIGLGSAALESVPTNVDALRSEVSRLVLQALIAMSLSADRENSSPMAGLIDHSAGPVGESLLLMGASDRGEGRHLVEKIAVDEVRDRTSRSRIGTGAISCLPARISCYVPQTRLDKRRLHSRFALHSRWLGSRELREMVMWRS